MQSAACPLLLSKCCLLPWVQAYAPAKLPFGQPHPDSVVETASLAAVEPPDITYQLKVGFQGLYKPVREFCAVG